MSKYINIKSLIVLLIFITFLFFRNQQKPSTATPIVITGITMGKISYTVKYLDPENRDLKDSVDALLKDFNQSLSTYIPDSEISRLNQSDSFVFESDFMLPVLRKSKKVYEITGGAFDPTVGALVNAWGFGSKKKMVLETNQLDSLLTTVGFHKIKFTDSTVWKSNLTTTLDFSAIAKGYAVDVVASLLLARDINDFMIEIGGEVRCSGHNFEGEVWRIGIDDPTVELVNDRSLKAIVSLSNRAMATSGNYRNFYIENGKKYAHTISPFSGKPVAHNLLSASVFSSDCMTADALATGMMVLGVEKSISIAEKHSHIDIFLIFEEDGRLKTYSSHGLKDMIETLEAR